MRSVSLAAGAGPSYVSSILREGKDPGISQLLAVCEASGANAAYIIFGLSSKPEDARLLELMTRNPEARDAILALLRAKAD